MGHSRVHLNKGEPRRWPLALDLDDVIELTRVAALEVLWKRGLAIDELGAELAPRIGRSLTLQLVICFAPRVETKMPFVLVDQWLGHPPPKIEPEAAPAELLPVMPDGEIVGTWRPRKRGRSLTLAVTMFGGSREPPSESLQHEAEQVATLRGASSVDIAFETP